MARAYSIWIVSPPGYIHSRCFEEVALALREAFAELGSDAPIVTKPEQATGRTIVLGCNLLNTSSALPQGCILYNLEQIDENSEWLVPDYFELLRANRVWDYSRRNIEALAGLAIAATQCEIGYSPGLTRISPSPAPDIDVAFIGSPNERREAVLKALRERGKRVFASANLYGAERDAIYARAKIVLNIHYYEAKVLEMVRCSYLLANRICVVSEIGADVETEAALAGGIAFAHYDDLVRTCLTLLDDSSARDRVAQKGFELFSARRQAPFLQAALAATP